MRKPGANPGPPPSADEASARRDGGTAASRDSDAASAAARSGRFFDQRLVRYLVLHCLDGVAAGWALMLGLLWTDVGRVRTLIHASDVGWLAMMMLIVAFAITFGSVGMGIAANRLGRAQGDRRGRD